LVNPDDIEALEETLELLSNQEAVRDLRDAEAAVAAGDVIRGVEHVRQLRGR
jgi:PHD/YefM family antitoxin component YafN of YafNO toxin-antitoxin module